MSIKISVIIPVYNAAPFLRQALDSVLQQTCTAIEVIAVDDGSTDESLIILRQYAKYDSRLRVISQTNSGPSSARNAGLSMAGGEYIGFMDADDYLELSMYDIMYSAAVHSQADIVLCNILRNEHERHAPYFSGGVYDRKGMKRVIFPRLLASCNELNGGSVIRGSACCRIFRSSLIRKHHIQFDPRFHANEDIAFVFHCTIHAQRYVYLADQYLYHNRLVYGSLSKGYREHFWETHQGLIDYFNELTSQCTDYDFTPQMQKRAFDFILNAIENEVKPDNPHHIVKRLQHVSRILAETKTREWINQIDPTLLNHRNKLSFFAIHHKLALLAYVIAHYRSRSIREQFRRQKRDHSVYIRGNTWHRSLLSLVLMIRILQPTPFV